MNYYPHKQNWMAIRATDTSGALARAYKERLSGFTVTSRQEKHITLKEGGTFVEFVSCSYLGLETHPALIEAASAALTTGGLHLSCSPNVMRPIYLPQLEALMGDIYEGCGVSVFTSTSSVHLGVLPLLGSDLLKAYPIRKRVRWLIEKTAHASMQVLRGVLKQFGEVSRVDAGDPESMNETLKHCINHKETPVLLIDGVGSISGLVPIAELAQELDRAGGYVYVDDAHGISITGHHGAGYAFSAVGHKLPSNMILAGSLSKAFGGSGGFVVVADPCDIETIKTLANPLIFGHSIMLPMLAANVAAAQIHLGREMNRLQHRLWANVSLIDSVTGHRLINAGIPSPLRGAMFESEEAGLKAARILRDYQILVFPVFYPIIPKGKAMIRFAISSTHSERDLRQLGAALSDINDAGLWNVDGPLDSN
ncbi:aminotransferase class I/II-fold pyridoxal phosphate-dependent enzyme [Pseudomonas koreensis]|uniref:aminotransferase class I/II-fold pyridoxal phosphate-dependent enzyme n=1 Tax=Pseudomonas koreensis TaxID=198620 RepID=UPI003F864BD2